MHLPGPLPTVYGPVFLPQSEGGSRYRLAAGSTIAYDSNVFRLPANTSPDAVGATGRSRSTIATRLYGQANADIPFGLQRFHGQVTGNAYSFNRLSYLNYQSIDGRAGWLWQMTDRFGGELRHDRVSGIADFIDARPTARNIRTVDYSLARAELQVGPRLSVGAGFAGTVGKNSDGALKVSDSRQLSREIGVRYRGIDRNYVGVFAAFTDGENPNLVSTATFDREYTQRDTGLDMLWGVSDVSFLRGRLALSDRRYPSVSANDFSGLTGNLEFNWRLSPLSGVAFTARRELAAFIETNATYFVNTALGASPWWEVLPKLRLEVAYEHWDRDYRGVNVTVPRSDKLQFARLALRWLPARNMQINAGLNWSRRDSNVDSFDFTDRVLFGQVEWSF